MKFNLRVRLAAEFVGSAFLVAAVVGSGIMGERLSGGNVAIALLANTIATGAALVALILTFGPISGAHLNPVVTLADAIEHGIAWPDALAYIVVQCTGGIAGAIIAHLMFGLRWYSFSTHSRHGWSLILSEFIATFGLLSVIWGCSRLRSGAVPFAVASYIIAAYWFTASTSFANPAVTIAGPSLTPSRGFDCQTYLHSSQRKWQEPWPRPSCFGGSSRTYRRMQTE
jgi:glycerol uptake facilitator-like aquaporin